MARLFSSGWELNYSSSAVGEWELVTNTPAISSSTKRTGSYAFEITSLTSGAAKAHWHKFASGNGNGPYFQRVYLNIGTLPSATTTIFTMLNNAQTKDQLSVKITAAGKLQLFCNNGATQIGSDSVALNTSQWYRIEIKLDRTGVSGAFIGELLIDGSVVATSSTLTSTNYSSGVDYCVVGGNWNAETCTTVDLFFDDFAINDNTGSFQNTYPGAGGILHLLPDSAGDNNQFTVNIGGTAGAANNYTRVNEVPPDGATSYNGDTVLNDTDEFNLAATPAAIGSGDTINVVAIGVQDASAIAANGSGYKLRCKKASGGTVSSSAQLTPTQATFFLHDGASLRTYALVLYQDPDSSNWTKATLDTAQIGYKITAAAVNATYISNIWMLVDFTPAAAGSIFPDMWHPGIEQPRERFEKTEVVSY